MKPEAILAEAERLVSDYVGECDKHYVATRHMQSQMCRLLIEVQKEAPDTTEKDS